MFKLMYIKSLTGSVSGLKVREKAGPTFGESPEFFGGEDAWRGDGVVADDVVERVPGVACPEKKFNLNTTAY